MNAWADRSLPKWLFVFVLASALAFTSSCSAPQAVPQPRFKPMPPPGQLDKPGYTTILGPVTGVGPRTFTIVARPGIAAWLGCIGKGLVWLRSPVGTFAAACANGGAFAGGLTHPTHVRPGQKVTVRVVAPATIRWELRIDGTPQVISDAGQEAPGAGPPAIITETLSRYHGLNPPPGQKSPRSRGCAPAYPRPQDKRPSESASSVLHGPDNAQPFDMVSL
jgi:hypothetical protein